MSKTQPPTPNQKGARDNFSAKTIRILQSRVGHRCSNPGCRKPTVGPALNKEKFVNVGVAAHITAAAEGGPRHDPTMTPEARSGVDNGIWLCQICAKLIDSDVDRFAVDLLRRWKKEATERAYSAVATAGATDPPVTTSDFESDQDDDQFIGSLGLPASDTLDVILARLSRAAEIDAAAFRSAREWPAHSIQLNLALVEPSRSPVTLDGMAKAIGVGEGVNLVSSPGTGKSTTIVQLAERVLAGRHFVPLIVPLGEWSERADDFFDCVNRRNAFGAFRRQHFMQLAYQGRLALLLDGWNELDPDSRRRAIRDLRALRRDFPQLGIVISTRPSAIPSEGAVVEVEPLSDAQQLEIARALRGPAGEALVDQAWRTPGVREMITIPLYLNALLALPPGAPFPQTKEEILRMFVLTHEQKPEIVATLQKSLHGFHEDMLVGLAVRANRTSNTIITATAARETISDIGKRLSTDGQLTIPIQTTDAIDVLVATHVLVRPDSKAGAVMFQHQQFQEWYGSLEVERLMRKAASGDSAALKSLREDILNWPAWEESILFAVERFSRDGSDGVAIAAFAILETLGIDPMLAAETIYRSTSDVWQRLEGRVMKFIERWHRPNKVDRAVRFMITSGRPEFSEKIWPLISNSDDEISLAAPRAADRFRSTVLGPDRAAKLAALPDKTRAHVMSDIARISGYEGMELAASLAKSDPNPDIVVQIVQALQFRHGDRHVTSILESASEAVWRILAHKNYPDQLTDPKLQRILEQVRADVADTEATPAQRLFALVAEEDSGDNALKVAAIIHSNGFDFSNDQNRHTFHQAYKKYPQQVGKALAERLSKGLDVPYDAVDYLKDVAATDDAAIIAIARGDGANLRLRRAAAALVGAKTVGQMIDELCALNDEYRAKNWQIDQASQTQYTNLKDAIEATRLATFVSAILERADTTDPARIALLADLMLRYGGGSQTRFDIEGKDQDRLAEAFDRWIDVFLASSPKVNRYQMSEVAWALGRLPLPQFAAKLKRMLDRDLEQRAKAKEEFERTHDVSIRQDITHDYTNLYCASFVAIGGDEVATLMKAYLRDLDFGVEAARALWMMWNNAQQPAKEDKLFGSTDFREVRERRRLRHDSATLPTTDAAEAIFSAVRQILVDTPDDKQQLHAISLAAIGLGMPHGSKRADCDQLLGLPVPYSSKLGLLTALARAGEILSSEMLLAGVRELLETAKRETWRLDENRGELTTWLRLFAFSERPMALMEAIALAPANYQAPWALRTVLQALGNSPHAEALSVLEALAERDPFFLQQHEWLEALTRLGTEAAARVLLRHIGDGTLASAQNGMNAWHLSKQLASFVVRFPHFRRDVVQLYSASTSRSVYEVLERSLVELPDAATVRAMVAKYAATGRTYREGSLPQAIRNLSVGRRPVENWPSAYEEFSVSLKSLREELFGLALSGNDASPIAEACLESIERRRDEHGRIDDEPRHPDIGAGRSWPLAWDESSD